MMGIPDMTRMAFVLVGGVFLSGAAVSPASEWPALPDVDATVTLPAQEWPHKPGPRMITALIHYPGGKRANVTEATGVMLTLHNWGGDNCVGTADPRQLANRLNVVAVCVNYLQSGKKASIDDPEPYDHGHLQALDALRSLWFVHQGLKAAKQPFAEGRLYCTGGSGGGNVTLMANKFAPRTFACLVDMCGMKKLSHDVAFRFPGGSDLDARWSRDPKSPHYLSMDEQELRFVGHPDHLKTMKSLGHSARVVVVHGSDDRTCPFADAEEMASSMKSSGFDVVPWFLTAKDLDGAVFTGTGHSLGNRTEIVFKVAGEFLTPGGPKSLARSGPSDFDLKDERVRYKTTNGAFVVSYKAGYPVSRFEPDPPPPEERNHQDVTTWRDETGAQRPIRVQADVDARRRQVQKNMERVMGPLPGVMWRVPLDPKTMEETKVGTLIRRKVTFQSDPDDRVPAWLFLPESAQGGSSRKTPAVLCLQQTTNAGKDEPAGISGDPNLHYALHLAQRGYIVLAPDYPSFGEHKYDFAPEHGYASGSMKAIWDNIRAVDYLVSLPQVDADRIGCIGHSLGGHNALFTAAFEPRIAVIVSSCGFCRFHKDDVPSWTGPRYMPRIASQFGDSADRLPFDFPEIIGTLAPRPFLTCSAKGDSDFDVNGVRETMEMARHPYHVLGMDDRLQEYYPEGGHGFPADARDVAYKFLDRHLKR